jgi:hypothetical protein
MNMTVVTAAGIIIMGIAGMRVRATVKAIVTMATARIKAMTKTTKYPLLLNGHLGLKQAEILSSRNKGLVFN